MKPAHRVAPDLQTLVDLFYASIEQLGEFEEVEANSMPEVFRALLVHDAHMTVTVEKHHGCAVDVQVVRSHASDSHYAREILLRRQSDKRIVQYGIVRLSLDYLDPDVRAEIEGEQMPLGRVLIQHNVLRTVKLLSVWKVTPGPELRALLGWATAAPCYGRTALIYCNGVIAVEMLEVVTQP